MDESLYDEFGNYIGPDLSDSDQVTPRRMAADPVGPPCKCLAARLCGGSAHAAPAAQPSVAQQQHLRSLRQRRNQCGGGHGLRGSNAPHLRP